MVCRSAGHGRAPAQHHPPRRGSYPDRRWRSIIFSILLLPEKGGVLFVLLRPVPKDAFDAWGTMRYYLGLSSEKPKFNRFSYAEKAEYWALVWGTALMGLTGIMIWAKVWVGDLLARMVGRRGDGHPLLRSDSGHAGDPRLALLPGVLRSPMSTR